MSGFIIITRNPNGRRLLAIVDESGSDSPSEFPTEGAAHLCADNIPICKAWGYEVVEVSK